MWETLSGQPMTMAPSVPLMKCFSVSQGKESFMKATHLLGKLCSVIVMLRALSSLCMSILGFQTMGETNGVSGA